METFCALLARCVGNSPVTKVNNREAGELRRHHAHYDITVMSYPLIPLPAITSYHLNDTISRSNPLRTMHKD